jgi:hypothetical protein
VLVPQLRFASAAGSRALSMPPVEVIGKTIAIAPF